MTTQRVRIVIFVLYLILPAVLALISLTNIESARAIRQANGMAVDERIGLIELLMFSYLSLSPAFIYGVYLIERREDLGPVFLALKQGALWLAARFHIAGRAAQNRGRKGPSDGV